MITSSYTLQEIYEQDNKSFVPDISDNPDNTWFYASWEGMKAVCQILEIDIEGINHLIHHAICDSRGDWSLILEDLKQQIQKLIVREKPTERYHSDSEPIFFQEDIEKRAREIFASQFKVAFPGKRINSKFAQEQWKEVKDKAFEIAKEELQDTHTLWKIEENRRQQELERQILQWQTHCDSINKLKLTIQKILDASERGGKCSQE